MRRSSGVVLVAVFVLASVAIAAVAHERGWLNRHPTRDEQQALVADIIKTNDPAACAKADGIVIDGIEYKHICEQNVYLNLANEKADFSYCDKLDPTFFPPDRCKTSVLAVKIASSSDASVCAVSASAVATSTCFGMYWSAQAQKQQDPALCANIADVRRASRCSDDTYLALITAHKDVSCKAFSAELGPDCAVFEKVVAAKSTSACDAIQDPRFIELCRGQLP